MTPVGPAPGGSGTISITLTIQLRRPPHVVWPYLIEARRLEEWMEEAREVRIEGGRFSGLGDEGRARVRIAGIATEDPIRITRWEPPWILEMEHAGWVRGRGYMELTPADGGTELFWREQLVPPWGLVGRIGMRLLTPVMRRRFRRDLERLQGMVQRGG